jgi:PhnB protein
MEAIVPYLNFNGNANEALNFYTRALNGQVIFKQTYGESPMENTADWKDKIMHASFQAGELQFMVSDIQSPDNQVTSGTNLSLSLNFKEEAEIEKVFAALSEGAHITMPLEKTFWGAKFGMLTDQFGINWMFNHDYAQK